MYIIFQNSRFIITLLLSNKLLFKNHKLKFSTLKNQCTKFYHYLMNSKKKKNKFRSTTYCYESKATF